MALIIQLHLSRPGYKLVQYDVQSVFHTLRLGVVDITVVLGSAAALRSYR